MLGQEVDLICQGCGNPDPLTMRIMEDGSHGCDRCCDRIQPPPVRDYTEKAFMSGVAPGKFRERLIEKHRAQVHENLRAMPNSVKKISE